MGKVEVSRTLVVNNQGKKARKCDPEADEVRPYVDCLVVALEERADSLTPCRISNAVATDNVWVKLVVFGCLFYFSYVRPTTVPTVLSCRNCL